MKGTLTVRVMLLFALLSTAITSLVFLLGGWLLQRQMRSGIIVMHDQEFEEWRQMIGNPTGITPEILRQRIGHDTDVDSSLYYFQVHDGHGGVLFRSANLDRTVLPIRPANTHIYEERLPGLGALLVSTYELGPLRMQIASSLTGWPQLFRHYAHIAGLLLAGAALASLALGYWFARMTLRPVRVIASTASRIGADNLKERIPIPEGRDELTQLALLLNGMFDRLEQSFRQVKQFTSDASHELKTPLALLRLEADKLEARLLQDPEGLSMLGDLREEIDRMSLVIENLLFLARAEGGALKLQMTRQNMQALISDFAEDIGLLAEDKNVNFELRANDPGEITANASLCRQLVFNLVSNALNVSKPGGKLTLSSTRSLCHWSLVIEDEGPGVPADQLEHIFARFVRLGTSDQQNGHRGSGLGLAICRSIAELHGGSIHAENRSDRSGLRVAVSLPDRS